MEFECGKCEQCPQMLGLNKEIGDKQHIKEHLVNDAMHPGVDEVVAPAMLEILKRTADSGLVMGPDGEELDTPEQVAATMRKTAAKIIDQVEEDIESIKETAEELADGCEGPLKMRAKKAGRIITATICNSPLAPNNGELDLVFVTREADK